MIPSIMGSIYNSINTVNNAQASIFRNNDSMVSLMNLGATMPYDSVSFRSLAEKSNQLELDNIRESVALKYARANREAWEKYLDEKIEKQGFSRLV